MATNGTCMGRVAKGTTTSPWWWLRMETGLMAGIGKQLGKKKKKEKKKGGKLDGRGEAQAESRRARKELVSSI